jgi:peptidoglycan/LPS O-acetylase OafA/YrhL
VASDTAGVPPTTAVDQRTSVRRALSWALVAALCVAALTAIAAILSGDFDETDGRVIGSSLGFAIFSATAASGASLRFRESESLRALGLAAMAFSAVSFLLLLVAMWIEADDNAWQWFGCAALAALACSHASVVSAAMRTSDSPTVQTLATTSIALGVVDSFFGILAFSGAVDDVDQGVGELIGVLVILLVLTTALAPILRRLERPATTPSRPAEAPRGLAAEVAAAADRIEALNGDPGNRAPDIRRECERLRELARSHPR